MVDPINIILHLHHDAAVLGHGARELAADCLATSAMTTTTTTVGTAVGTTAQTLGLLEREGAVLAAARVHLEGVLVRVDVEADAGPGRRQAGDVVVVRAPVVRGGAVDEPAVVCFFVAG